MCDHHDVQALDRLEVVWRHRVGHHPGVDQHVLAACSADLPGAMTDPGELDLIVDRHMPPPWTRGLVRGRDKTARPRAEPVPGHLHRGPAFAPIRLPRATASIPLPAGIR